MIGTYCIISLDFDRIFPVCGEDEADAVASVESSIFEQGTPKEFFDREYSEWGVYLCHGQELSYIAKVLRWEF